jgi:hypothetical protein
LTAAHCLPFFPPCHAWSYIEERTYRSLLAPLGEQPAIAAECLFCDPIGDIAVLGSPDRQQPELYEDSNKYDALVDAVTPFKFSAGPSRLDAMLEAHGRARLLSLDGRWFECRVRCFRHGPWSVMGAEPIRGGMSGSPIVAWNGPAIGVVCCGSLGEGGKDLNSGDANARLSRNLPGWLLCQWQPSGKAALPAARASYHLKISA